MAKPTGPQLKVLSNLVNGRRAGSHLRTQSEYGGMEGTIRSMVKRGWITWGQELTEDGRRVAAACGIAKKEAGAKAGR